eukprot:4787197-Prymnesium_polylepis.1
MLNRLALSHQLGIRLQHGGLSPGEIAFDEPSLHRAEGLRKATEIGAVDSLQALFEIWGAEDEEAAERQMRSFSLIGDAKAFDTVQRLAAMQCRDTVGRLAIAKRMLMLRKGKLEAEVALRGALFK